MVAVLPYVSIFSQPDCFSEHIDELLFGEECEIIGEYGNFWEIETDYGYRGYIIKNGIAPKRFKANCVVKLPFADLLFEKRNYFRPVITLPLGARLYVEENSENERYCTAMLQNGQECFVHKNHIKRLFSFPENEQESRKRITETAKMYLGFQYRWGGRTPSGIDCSGLCFNACRFNGFHIWRDADMKMSRNLRDIPFECAKSGDLMFFKGHMAVYLGNGEIIHSSASKGRVIIEEYEKNSYLKEIYISTGTLF